MSSKFIYYVYCHLSMKNTFYYPYLITKWISLSNEKGNENNNMRYNHIVIRKREVIIFTLYIYIFFLGAILSCGLWRMRWVISPIM